MSTRSQLTKDLNESVKGLLGKHVKILLKNVVRLETRGDKTENRVLVFSPCRLFLLTAKVPTRIDCHFHYLEIQALESKRGNQLSLTVNEKIYSFLTGEDSTCSTEVDSMVCALATAIRNIFPTVPLQYIIKKVEVIPGSRLQQVRDGELTAAGGRGVGPCGGFSTQYACMCDYHSVPYREEVAWDVDTIYLSHDTRELCLKDFDHLDQKDLVPILSALEYNTWFTKLRASHIKLTHEAIDRVLHVMRKSLSLEELYLDNLGLKADFAHRLSMALVANEATPLHTLDLSNNMLEDKGAIHLNKPIARVPKGLVHLNLAHCGLTCKGVNNIAQALSQNKTMHTTLTYLNLSGNNLKDEINNLYNFLAQPNAVSHLDISSTDTMLESLFGALLRGCSTNLVHLNVSKNPFSSKKSKEVPPSFKQFFTSTLNLKYLNMAFCKLPLEALKNLLLGLACNESTTEIELDLSSNSLGQQGAHVLESCVHGVRCISSLDISDNNMDVELASVVTAVSKNKSLKHLHMGRNLNNMKAKHIATVMDALVQMIQEEDCVLQSLLIPDSKLKSDLYNLINALGSNNCLQTIDISGNFMGDSGARLLAKALQINNRLRTIIYDRNNITLQGYSDLAYALENNYTVRYMPFPIFDIMPCMKTNSDRTDTVMRKIQDLLHRNVSPKKYSNSQAFRLQQGFLLSSTQQMVDRLVVQTQDTIKSLAAESCDSNNDINHATGLIQDADNSKHLLLRLQDVVHRKDETNPVESKMQQAANEIHSVVVDFLKESVENMMRCAKEQCPHVLYDNTVVHEIRQGCRDKSGVPLDFVQQCVVQQAGTDIINRVNELNLAAAAHVSDRVTDEVIESLSRSYKTLVGDVTRSKSGSSPEGIRSGSRSRLNSSDSSRHDASDLSITDASHQSDQSPMATPHLSSKRKSLHGRKLRPKSVVDSVEGLSADDIPCLLPTLPFPQPTLPKSAEESLDSVSELPNATQQLQHLVKGRPRRAKTRAPTRPMLRPGDVTDALVHDLGEGLDTFFRPGSVTPTTPLISPTSDECSSLSFQADGSPNHEFVRYGGGTTSGETTPVLGEERRNGGNSVKFGRSSPLLKVSFVEPAPRSRSTDNLQKYSPLIGRRSQGDSPLTASPLARRVATEDSPIMSRDNSSNSICMDAASDMKRLVNNNKEKRISSSSVEEDKPIASASVKLRSTGLADSLRSPTNGFPKTATGLTDIPKSPILKSIKDSNSNSKIKPAPPTAPKPRPWSMAGSDRKSGEFNNLLSDGTASPVTPTGNTPDSSGDALDDSDSHSDRRSVRDMAAGINKGGSTTSVDNKKEAELQNSLSDSNLSKPIAAPRKFIPRRQEAITDEKRKAVLTAKSNLLAKRTTSRDNNYNFDDVIDV